MAKRVEALARFQGLEAEPAAALLTEALALATERVEVVAEPLYAAHKTVALNRVPRDPDDWPTVALALWLGAAVWTHDGDFLGCGLATWTTETPARLLDEEGG